MARNKDTEVLEPQGDVDVDLTEVEDDETDTVPTDATGSPEGESKAPAKPKNPRWTPPEGFVTLVGAAKVITDKGLYFPRGSETPGELPSQQVYSLANGSSKTDPFPETKFDDEGNQSETGQHRAVKVEDLVAWWERKNTRVKERAANAKDKAEKAKSKPAATPTAEVTEATEDDTDVTYLTDGDSASAAEDVE
jgi:hypothetical protein